MYGYKYALAAATALALTGPALAQTSWSSGGSSEPLSTRASNINPRDSASTVAPRLPMPNVGEDATIRAYLQDARQALANGRTGLSQEAMERAETRLLDRSVEPSRVGVPADNSLVTTIAQARQALGAGDRAAAIQLLDVALANVSDGAAQPSYPAVPSPRAERVPPPSGPGQTWEPGHWNWNGTAYDWSAGRYVAQTAPNVFVQGRWVMQGNAWVWEAAHWEG